MQEKQLGVEGSLAGVAKPAVSFAQWFRKVVIPNRYLFLMFLPGLLYFLIFHYLPMFGIVVAFQRYSPYLGILKSPWVGFRNFVDFFGGPYAWRIIRNTLLLNLYGLAFGFPAPIILALLLNELRIDWFKRFVQTITYFPYFISMAVVGGLVVQLLSPSGTLNILVGQILKMTPINFLEHAKYFRGIFVTANIWRGVGFGAIIYLAAIAGIDAELYEAAVIDGAGRWRQMRFITVPSLVPTITILLLLNLGNILSVGVELILLIYNSLTYETADVIGTFVYRRGISSWSGPPDFGLGAAVGLFQSVIGLVLLVISNRLARIIGGTSLW